MPIHAIIARTALAATLVAAASGPLRAETLTVAPVPITEWKAVYGRVEARDTVPARARIGGTLASLEVEEGDAVTAGQRIAVVTDEKIAFQIDAIDARLRALGSELENAEAELERAETLVARGVTTRQRVDQLATAVDVVRNQIAAAEAERSVIVQQGAEGEVLAPAAGRVLDVPVTEGAVVLPGEPIAMLGSGGTFLRLAIPERHATRLEDGALIEIEDESGVETGRLAKVYPEIENGRVIADVEVEDLDADFVGARVLVRLPVGEREAILVPQSAVHTRAGLDFVAVADGDGTVERTVLIGGEVRRDGRTFIEILTGLAAGDDVVIQ